MQKAQILKDRTLVIKSTKDRHGKPLATVENFPVLDAEMYADVLRKMEMDLMDAADRLDRMEIDILTALKRR
jgi:hypothetical protein